MHAHVRRASPPDKIPRRDGAPVARRARLDAMVPTTAALYDVIGNGRRCTNSYDAAAWDRGRLARWLRTDALEGGRAARGPSHGRDILCKAALCGMELLG